MSTGALVAVKLDESAESRRSRWVGHGMLGVAVLATINVPLSSVVNTGLMGRWLVPVGLTLLLFVPPVSDATVAKARDLAAENVATLRAGLLLTAMQLLLAWLLTR